MILNVDVHGALFDVFSTKQLAIITVVLSFGIRLLDSLTRPTNDVRQ